MSERINGLQTSAQRDRSTEFTESSFLENLKEHVFISELLQEVWVARAQQVDILRSEVDSSGYDLVLECGTVIRHVQLKSSRSNAKTSRQTVNIKLADKPAGCVVWLLWEEHPKSSRIRFNYLFYGKGPREPLTDLKRLEKGKHTKGDRAGHKAERPNTRVLKRAMFRKIDTMRELTDTLFGPLL